MLIGIDASRAALARRTGTENYSLQLIRHLLALESGHRYRLYFSRPPEASLFPSASDLRIIPFPRLWTHVRLSWEMAFRPPDVLFVPAHVLPVVHPRRSVATVHDLGYLYYPEAHRPLDRLYLDLSTRYNVWAAKQIIAVSGATRRDLIERYKVEPGKITVVHSGLDGGLGPVEDKTLIERVKKRYGIEGDYILYVGTLHPRKNLVRLVEAYNLLKNKTPSLKLVVAGKCGWLYEEVFRRVEALGLIGAVLFPGYVEQDDLAALLSGSRLFVLPSLYEGFGFPVLEAMACGTAVVCSNVSSLPEVAGEAALLVDPLDVAALAEAMEQALDDERLNTDLVRRGFQQVKKFSWNRCARQTLTVLETL